MRQIQYPELPNNIMLPDATYDTDHGADGFSLLELVVAVSIMLILGVVGFVGYQTYTDNARQANVDSQANQVLTAAVAADNAPNDSVNNAVREYNKSSSEISANITEATPESLTVSAVDRVGTLGMASISGNYGHVETTNFSPPGITYAWTGEPGASTSIKKLDGEVIATNHVPGMHGWSNPAGETIFSPQHAMVTQNARFGFTIDIPDGVDMIRHRYEMRATEPFAGNEEGLAAFHNGFWGTDTVSGRALPFPADGAWHSTESRTILRDDATEFTMFFLGNSRYAHEYEIRNVQIAMNDEPFVDFFTGDSL